jgi:hypothetical protein
MRNSTIVVTHFLALVVFALVSVSAQAVTAPLSVTESHIVGTSLMAQGIQPRAVGGGCNPFATVSSRGDITATGCISYNFPYLQPDGYVSISPLAAVRSCFVDVQLYDGNGNFITKQRYGCTLRANIRYGPFSYFTLSGTYYGCVDVNLSYYNGTGSSAVNCSGIESV